MSLNFETQVEDKNRRSVGVHKIRIRHSKVNFFQFFNMLMKCEGIYVNISTHIIRYKFINTVQIFIAKSMSAQQSSLYILFILKIYLFTIFFPVVLIHCNGSIFDPLILKDYSLLSTLLHKYDKMNQLQNRINIRGAVGQTPLMYATLNNDSVAVDMLLQAGADATIAEAEGYTPMDAANFNGYFDVLSVLLKHGVNPSPRHSDGYTPLHRACWGSTDAHTECVRLLITVGLVDPLEMTGPDTGMDPESCLDFAGREPTYALIKEQALVRKLKREEAELADFLSQQSEEVMDTSEMAIIRQFDDIDVDEFANH